jgi:hypothetical protein
MSLCHYIAQNKLKTLIHLIGVVVWVIISVFGSLKVLPKYQIHHEHRGVVIMFYFIYGFLVSVVVAIVIGGIVMLLNKCIRCSSSSSEEEEQTSRKNKVESVENV